MADMTPEEAEHWKEFGKWVCSQRENTIIDRKTLSKAAAAKRAPMSRQHWTAIENGETGVSREMVHKILKALMIDKNDERHNLIFVLAFGAPDAARDIEADDSVRIPSNVRDFYSTNPTPQQLALVDAVIDLAASVKPVEAPPLKLVDGGLTNHPELTRERAESLTANEDQSIAAYDNVIESDTDSKMGKRKAEVDKRKSGKILPHKGAQDGK